MKKSILALTALCLLCLSPLLAQTIEYNVTLSDDKPGFQESLFKDNLDQSVLDVSVVKGEPDSNGNIEVTLTLTNNNPETSFYMFSKKNTVKELKKKRPRIVYDRSSFGGSMDPKTLLTDAYKIPEVRYGNDYHIDNAHYNSPVFKFTLQEDETVTCVLPIYRVEEKKGLFSKRLLIKGERITTLNITVETKIHEDYDAIKNQCEDLFSRISKEVFCRHKLHRTNLEKQKEPYITERDALKERIQLILGQNQWGENNTNRKNYEDLIARLNELEGKMEAREVDDCKVASNHVQQNHYCGYCSKSLEDLLLLLEDYYAKRVSLTKEDKKEIEDIYKCCKSRKEWKKGNNPYIKQIKEYYNRIPK